MTWDNHRRVIGGIGTECRTEITSWSTLDRSEGLPARHVDQRPAGALFAQGGNRSIFAAAPVD